MLEILTSGLLGVLIGILVNIYNQKQREAKKIKTAKILFRKEIDINRNLVIPFWNKFKSIDEKDEKFHTQLRKILLITPVPQFRKEVFETHLSFLALFNEEEAIYIFQLYNYLSQIDPLRNHMLILSEQEDMGIEKFNFQQQQKQQSDSRPFFNPWPNHYFKDNALELWKEFEQIISKICEDNILTSNTKSLK